MFNFFRKCQIQAGIVTTLGTLGLNKQPLRDCMQTPQALAATKVIVNTVKGMPVQHQNLIASLVFIDLLKQEGVYVDFRVTEELVDAIKLQILQGADWYVIGSKISVLYHLLFNEKLMTEEEIKEMLHPDNITLQTL